MHGHVVRLRRIGCLGAGEEVCGSYVDVYLWSASNTFAIEFTTERAAARNVMCQAWTVTDLRARRV